MISLGLLLRPQEFVLAAGYRLGLPLYDEGRSVTGATTPCMRWPKEGGVLNFWFPMTL